MANVALGDRWQSATRPHPDRFSFVATQRRPLRIIKSVNARADGVTLSLDCGHSCECVPHFTYKVGTETTCLACGIEVASDLPEFKGWYDATGLAL